MEKKWLISATVILGAVLGAATAQASDRVSRAQNLDQNGWQVASDSGDAICMPMHVIFGGIASPQELYRQIPQYTGQPLHVQFSSDHMALFVDDSGRMAPKMLILGKDRCLSFLRGKQQKPMTMDEMNDLLGD